MLEAETTRRVTQIAEEVLAKFAKVASIAEMNHRGASGPTPGVLINPTATAVERINTVARELHDGYAQLMREPAIARVEVAGDDGARNVHYFCRGAQGMPKEHVISYRAPVGRLASLPIGDEFQYPDGRVVQVLGRSYLHPARAQGNWDSYRTIIEADHLDALTIESLLALITGATAENEDVLSKLLAEDAAQVNIVEGVRRSVITKMGLRDQPILDQYQDEIFRLPLDKRLLILGPPGTGKTTTLIRRLGQKRDTVYLDEAEQRRVKAIEGTRGAPHASSWTMFTPTDLLKQYLKEAFAREDVPASDLSIKTWHEYRRELARGELAVLRASSGGGIFVLKDELQSLTDDALQDPRQWFEDFNSWQMDNYAQELRTTSEQLGESTIRGAREAGRRLQSILAKETKGVSVQAFLALAPEAGKLTDLVNGLKGTSDQKLRGVLNLQLNRDRAFLDGLALFLDGLQETDTSDTEDSDDLDDEEDDAPGFHTKRQVAVNAYMRALRTQARAAATGRTVKKASRTGQILAWLGDRGLNSGDQAEVGASLTVQSRARRFVNPAKRYIDGTAKRYRAFRRERQRDGRWYTSGGFEAREIHPLELDVVLLAILRAANAFFAHRDIQRDIDNPTWSSLKPIVARYRNQILVDEVTDFSPTQLACMAALSDPRLQSFFACGDFNQRLTTWGLRTVEDVKWALPDLDVKEITVSYRQSRQLNELARAIIRVAGGAEQTVSLPTRVDNEGVAPALREQTRDLADTVDWLAGRIREIERFVGELPSIAVFVNGETDVSPLAEALGDALTVDNVQVVACHDGRIVGQDANVRVFDVQHIKGLEFEAVFFVGVDRLAVLHPTLFDKYLYVGTTRAASYLGITCAERLPLVVESLRPQFCSDWKQLGV